MNSFDIQLILIIKLSRIYKSIGVAAHDDLSPQARDGPECGGAEQVLQRLQEDELRQHRLGLHIQIHCQVGRDHNPVMYS